MATPQDNFRFLNFLKANTPITGWWMAATGQIGAVSSAVSILTAVIDAPQILVMLHLNKLAKMRITLKGGRHQVEI